MYWLDLYKFGKFVLRKEICGSVDEAIENAEKEIKGMRCTSGRLVSVEDNKVAWRGYAPERAH